MNIVDLPLARLVEAPWNPNAMDLRMLGRLEESIRRYCLLIPLVVRPARDVYEVLSGNQRLGVIANLEFDTAPCIIVDLADAHARLLAQALNHLHGEDDLGLRAELLRTVLEHLPEQDVLAVLPESAESLRQLASLGQQGMADYLQSWQQAQTARLRHFTAQLTSDQWALVEGIIAEFLPQVTAGDGGNPNRTGLALVQLCEAYARLRGAR